jgi:hypothetical protein
MSIKEEISRRSRIANRLVIAWAIVEGVVRLGILLIGSSWLRWVENAAAGAFLFTLGLVWLDFRMMQIAEAAMGEMQEYIDRRFDEKESVNILHK